MSKYPRGLGAHLKAGALAGIAGGVVEVIFMAIYCSLSGKNGMEILRYVAYTFYNGGALSGLFIHLVLSLLIGLVFGLVVYSARHVGVHARYPVIAAVGVVMLVIVWAFNFFVLLPSINPEFVAFVPLEAAFFSKLSFGLTLGLYELLLRSSNAAMSTLPATRARQIAG